MIPEFTIGDRLRKARELADMEQIPFATKIGVSRASITNWENGHTVPKRMVLNAWALATGVPVEWLQTGAVPRNMHPDGRMPHAVGDTARPEGFEPPTFWLVADGAPADVVEEAPELPDADVIPIRGRAASLSLPEAESA